MTSLSLGVGGFCNGQGRNSTLTLNSQPLCLCNSGFSGASDFFDTRISGTNGLSLTCTSSRIGEIVVWSLVILVGVYREFHVSKGLVGRYNKIKEKKHTIVELFSDLPFRVFFIDTFFLFTFVQVTAIAKIVGQVLGTDVLVTIAFCLMVITFQLVNSDVDQNQFATLCSPMRMETKEILIKLRFRIEFLTWSYYCLGVVIPTTTMLFLPKNVGPIDNNEYIALLCRNLLTVCWAISSYVGLRMILRRFKSLIRDSDSMVSKTNEVLDTLRQESSKKTRFFLLIIMLYSIFCIPVLWPFQTYMVSFIVIMGGLRHPGKVFGKISTGNSSDPNSRSPRPSELKSDMNQSLVIVKSGFESSPPKSYLDI